MPLLRFSNIGNGGIPNYDKILIKEIRGEQVCSYLDSNNCPNGFSHFLNRSAIRCDVLSNGDGSIHVTGSRIELK